MSESHKTNHKMESILTQADLSELRKKLKKQKKKIAFTSGSFDLLHVGHARYLEEAKKCGDVLVVGLNSNEAIQKVKGKNLGKPILHEKVRGEMLLYMRAVDHVVIVPEPTVKPTLELLQPDVFVTVGEDWNQDFDKSPEAKAVKEYGGKIKLVPRQSKSVSTTKIIEKIISSHVKSTFKDYFRNYTKPLKDR